MGPRRACTLKRTGPPIHRMGPARRGRRGGPSRPARAVDPAGMMAPLEACCPELTALTARCLPGGAAGWLREPTFFLALERRMHFGETAGDEDERARHSERSVGGRVAHVLWHSTAQRPRRAVHSWRHVQQPPGCSPPPRGRVGTARAVARAACSRGAARVMHTLDYAKFCRMRSCEIKTRSWVNMLH
jgi:hypothetical protein